MERDGRGKRMMMINHSDLPKQCPRCESTDTKFCYFNNYSQKQPRHFCRACRRYWTDGGTLRNVPLGGGTYCRGSKRTRRGVTPPTGTTCPQVMTPAPPPPLQQQQPFFFGGGMGSEGMMATVADFGGLQVPYSQQQLLPAAQFYNLAMQPAPLHLQQPPAFEANQMIQKQQPRVAVASCQQTDITLFASSTAAGPAVSVSTVCTPNGEGYWNEFNNIVVEEECSASQPPNTPSAPVL